MISEERIQQLWNEYSDYISSWRKRIAFARAIEAEVAAPLEARIKQLDQECEYDQRNAAMSQRESAMLLDKVADLENLLLAENQRKQQLEGDLLAANAEISRLKLYEPGNRAKPMDKPVQVAATKLSYWGIVEEDEVKC